MPTTREFSLCVLVLMGLCLVPERAVANGPGGPNPDPANIVGSVGSALITVYPTGVADAPSGGRTDTDNFQWAVEAVRLGGTVRLMDVNRSGIPTAFTLGKNVGTAFSPQNRPTGKVGRNGTTFYEYTDEFSSALNIAAFAGSLNANFFELLGDLRALAQPVRIARRCTVRGNGVDAAGYPKTRITLGSPYRFDEFVAIDKVTFNGAYADLLNAPPLLGRPSALARKSEWLPGGPNPECPYDYVAYILVENDFVTLEDIRFDRLAKGGLNIMHPSHLKNLRFEKCGEFVLQFDLDPLSIYPTGADGTFDFARGTRTIMENCTSDSFGALINAFCGETVIRNNRFRQRQGTHWIINGWTGIGADKNKRITQALADAPPEGYPDGLPEGLAEFCFNRELIGNTFEGVPQTPTWGGGRAFSVGGVLVRGSLVTAAHVKGITMVGNTIRNLPYNNIIQENWASPLAGSDEIMENVIVAGNEFHNAAGNTFNPYTFDIGAGGGYGNLRIVNLAITDNDITYDAACPLWNPNGLPDIWVEHSTDVLIARNWIQGKPASLNFIFTSLEVAETKNCLVIGNRFTDVNSFGAVDILLGENTLLAGNKYSASGLPGWDLGAGCILLQDSTNTLVLERDFPAGTDRCDQVLDIGGVDTTIIPPCSTDAPLSTLSARRSAMAAPAMGDEAHEKQVAPRRRPGF